MIARVCHTYRYFRSNCACQSCGRGTERRRRAQSISPGREPWVNGAIAVSAEGAEEHSVAPSGLVSNELSYPGLTPWADTLGAPSARLSAILFEPKCARKSGGQP